MSSSAAGEAASRRSMRAAGVWSRPSAGALLSAHHQISEPATASLCRRGSRPLRLARRWGWAGLVEVAGEGEEGSRIFWQRLQKVVGGGRRRRPAGGGEGTRQG
jgi:hypothetical protein